MSEIKVNSIKGVGASAAAITVNNTDGTCTANITNNLSNRNLVINGAMQVAQRGTSSTTSGYGSVDRFEVTYSGTDEAPTHAQADVASGTTPYTLGFRKSLKVTNGNQTSGAGDFLRINHIFEAQNIANSGWNYLSTSSFITVSFWVKSSVAQNFYGYLYTYDGSNYQYPFETGTLTADTWTKITKTIPGNSNITIDNNIAQGLIFVISPFFGTNYTASGVTLNAWKAWNSSERTPDSTSTWYTTNDATFEITGVQLEVSDHATDFEHRSFGDELAKCHRYCYAHITPQSGSNATIGLGTYYNSSNFFMHVPFPVTMRAAPTVVCQDSTDAFKVFRNGSNDALDEFHMENAIFSNNNGAELVNNTDASGTAGHGGFVRKEGGSVTTLYFSAEL